MADQDSLPITRRGAMAGAAGLALATSAAQAQSTGPVTAKGVVFEDTDGSFKRTPASKGLPGVMVSNGRDVVKTGADGSYSLPVLPGDSVLLIKPTGFAPAHDPATNLPLSSYCYCPDGTPDAMNTRFAGLAPTGPLPDSIDFGLRRQDEPAAFDAILFTDTQPETLAELGYVRDDVVAQTAAAPAAFALHHGDILFDDLSVYPRYNAIAGTMGLPWYVCPGNHDMNLEAPDNTHSRDTFKRVFGRRHTAMQYGGVTFFLLDNVEYLGTDPAKPNGFGKYQGRIGPEQLAFIRNVLANVPTDSLVVYSMHIPLKTLAGTDGGFANTDTRDFLAAISTHPKSVSFSGHTHTNEHHYFGAADGFTGGEHHHHVLAAVSGSWWSGPFDERGIPSALQTDGAPNGYHILSVDKGAYRTALVPASDPERSQMRIVLDSQLHRDGAEILREYMPGSLLGGPISSAATRSTRVLVNVFDGGPKTSVTLSVGAQGEPVTMTRVERRDPFVDEVYARNPGTIKPWVKSLPSSHIWQATLPAGLPAGAHRLAAVATDDYGRKHTAWMVLEVMGA